MTFCYVYKSVMWSLFGSLYLSYTVIETIYSQYASQLDGFYSPIIIEIPNAY